MTHRFCSALTGFAVSEGGEVEVRNDHPGDLTMTEIRTATRDVCQPRARRPASQCALTLTTWEAQPPCWGPRPLCPSFGEGEKRIPCQAVAL